MKSQNRQNDILILLQRDGRVTVEDLVHRYQTTPQTIRKDLRQLEAAQHAVRFHGGAVIVPRGDYINYEHRRSIAKAQKKSIGAACAKLIPNHATVFINIGTTTEAAAEALKNHSGLRVITDNVRVANELRQYPGVEILIAGGAVRASDGAIVGEQAMHFIRQFRVDYAIIGAAAIEADGSLLDYDLREAQVASAIIDTARHVILAADNGKFSRVAPVCIGQLSQIDTFVTNARPPSEIVALCAENDVTIVIA